MFSQAKYVAGVGDVDKSNLKNHISTPTNDCAVIGSGNEWQGVHKLAFSTVIIMAITHSTELASLQYQETLHRDG